MTSDEVHKSHWVITIITPNQLKRMKEDHHELSDLEEWIESFPPEEIFSGLRISCYQNEVGIDDDVNRCVNESKEC